ncbi:MAG: bifunctional [glutamine synthetase] adenylyltransferase/[glutamine synthetase]-adenylyl-L-tyrosine phosphorylase [Alphaproteobacteria bacterium]|nr:MAG: bifunctional [glutamine synthetase] adenylyltransferase/[glutamine synthetase]-adenylyl-L-tyrosine phosphorylase [Alphaproteobacteria bacterium]
MALPLSCDSIPGIGSPERAAHAMETWSARLNELDDESLRQRLETLTGDPPVRRLLEAVFGNSPFLTHCVLCDPAFFAELTTRGPEAVLRDTGAWLKHTLSHEADRAQLMRGLRVARRRAALAVAVADLGGLWPLERQLEALSTFADQAVSTALSHLLRQAAARGEIDLPDPEAPEEACGYVILGMGKLGACELNYSSDIDLIVVFDPERARYLHARGPQEGFVRLTRDLVRILEERTAEGYVFRTDLRLRPDPGAMPIAISFNAAMTYYESLGQNWERAAMIKARPVAGDMALGRRFLDELGPFVWRKSLDFLAIQDIHSIKRQIHAHKGGAHIKVAGHNIKLGRGGIREIELFVQTQQLIWGGREPRLRAARTLDALAALAEAGHIEARTAADMSAAYRYLRRLEHRLQMVEDQQTQTLPQDEAGLNRIAIFMGYDGLDAFRKALLEVLRTVENHYAELFEEAPALSPAGNLVFTGGEPEPGTLATLEALGFKDGVRVFNLVRAWHHGRHRATRSTRSRELLTELMPSLLEALGRTPQPDQALAKFDEFLAGLPTGVQLFAMLHANPELLDMLAEIMGGAPALAERLSRRPGLLEAVLSPGFFEPIPDRATLQRELDELLAQARDYQDVLDIARRWAHDRRFQAGVHILRHITDIDESGRALSDIADTVLNGLYASVLAEMERRHGRVPGPGMAVVAMGKLGGREMTFSSDLDLVFVYEADPGVEASDGTKPLPVSQYFARLAQRYISALSALTPEGRLYDIDMRLRPSGAKGPVATTLTGWRRYYEHEAWTWEHMALTRARVVVGEAALAQKITAAVHDILCAPREATRLLIDVAEMRARIEREHPATSLWSVKYLRGGLLDLEFLAQYEQLRIAHDHPEVIDGATQKAFAKLARAGVMGPALAERLITATRLMRTVQGLLRLTAAPAFDADQGTPGLQAALARAAGMADFPTLRATLATTAQTVYEVFVERIETPARAAGAKLDPNTDPSPRRGRR